MFSTMTALKYLDGFTYAERTFIDSLKNCVPQLGLMPQVSILSAMTRFGPKFLNY
jgi:hypothetical protein